MKSLQRKVRVLVVDDSAPVRLALSKLLSGNPGIEVVASARDAMEARELITKHRPDVMTLDVEMPGMDGITFLKKVMAEKPMPVVMCSSLMKKGSDKIGEAFEAGAIEAIEKPKIGPNGFCEESETQITHAVIAASAARLGILSKRPSRATDLAPAAKPDVPERRLRRGSAPSPLIAIGASTGGTEALKLLLSRLPASMPPILIVQHMPASFTNAFAGRLDRNSKLAVREAKDGDRVGPGEVLLAPGGLHMSLDRARQYYRVSVKDGPLVTRHRPSVDVLFSSVALHVGPQAIGVIMTGMGEDGARGMKEMRDAGAHTYGQNEESCAVYGMPQVAMKRGAVEREGDPVQLAQMLVRLCKTGGEMAPARSLAHE